MLVFFTHSCTITRDFPPSSSFDHAFIVLRRPIINKITVCWVQQYMNANIFLLQTRTVKLKLGPGKKEFILKSVAFHLCKMKRHFESRELQAGFVENVDKTHFQFNMDNVKTLGLIGDQYVKYANVFPGGKPITVIVRFSCGVHAKIYPLFDFQERLSFSSD